MRRAVIRCHVASDERCIRASELRLTRFCTQPIRLIKPCMGSLLGRYSVVQAETPRQGLVNLGVLLARAGDRFAAPALPAGSGIAGVDEKKTWMCCAPWGTIWRERRRKWAPRNCSIIWNPISRARIRVTDREEVASGGFRARARPVVFEERPKQRARVPHASAALLAAGGGRKISREPGDFRRGLGGGARRSAPERRYVCGADCRGSRWSRGFPMARCAFSGTA